MLIFLQTTILGLLNLTYLIRISFWNYEYQKIIICQNVSSLINIYVESSSLVPWIILLAPMLFAGVLFLSRHKRVFIACAQCAQCALYRPFISHLQALIMPLLHHFCFSVTNYYSIKQSRYS
jgi:hypothetical protein